MSEAYCHEINEHLEQYKTWKLDRVMFSCCIIGKDDKGDDVIGPDNLMDYIGKTCNKRNGRVVFERNPAWSDYQNKDSRQLLTNELVKAFFDEGVVIANRGWFSDRLGSVYKCQRGKVFKDQSTASPSKQRKTSTVKPKTKEDACGFMFTVQWSTDENCWYIKGGNGCCEHTNHIQKASSDLKGTTKMLDPEEKKIAADMKQIHCRRGAVQALVLNRTGRRLTSAQTEYVMGSLVEPILRDDNGKKSPAQQLVDYLKSCPDVSYVLITDKRIDSNMVTIKKMTASQKAALQKRLATSIHCEFRSASSQPGDSNEVDHADLKPTAADAAEAYAKGVRKALSLNDDTEVLLGVAWITEEAKRLYSMYPEVLAADVTEQVNREKRGLMLLAGLTSNKKSFTVCQAFLPSNCKWVFDWFFSTALPVLLPKQARMLATLILTDGDGNEIASLKQAIKNGVFRPTCKHRVCSWHRFNRGMLKDGVIAPADEKGKEYFAVAVKWMQSWCSRIETDPEFKLSFQFIVNWLSDPATRAILGASAQLLLDFLHTKVWPNRNSFLRSKFFSFRTYDRQATQFVEAENSVLKTHATGTNPMQSLLASGKSITELNGRRYGAKRQEAASAFDRVPTKGNDTRFEQECTPYVVEQVSREYKQAGQRKVTRVAPTQFIVVTQGTQRYVEGTSSLSPLEFKLIPRFARTRVVSVVTRQQHTLTNNQSHSGSLAPTLYLKCSCCMFERFAFPCRHIYAVLQRRPRVEDVGIRYHKSFMYLYGDKERSVTDMFDTAIMDESPGPVYVETNQPLGTQGDIVALTSLASQLEPVLRTDCHWHQVLNTHRTTALQDVSNCGGAPKHQQTCMNTSSIRQEVKLSQVAAMDAMQDNKTDWTDVANASDDVQDDSDNEMEANEDSESQKEHDIRSLDLQRGFGDWQAWIQAISKITESCPKAYVHVANALPKLYEEANAIAAQNQKQAATANYTSGMVSSMLPLETKRVAKRKRPKLDVKK